MHLQLPVQPVFITTNVRTPFMARCTRYNIMWLATFLWVLRFPQVINLTATIPSPQSTNQLNKINTAAYSRNWYTSGAFWWSFVPQYLDFFVVNYGLLQLSNVRLYFRRMENNPIAFVSENAFENLPQLTSL